MFGQNIEAFIILAAAAMNAQGEDVNAKIQAKPAKPMTAQERALSAPELRGMRAVRPAPAPAKARH